ncbi:MAG TPA: sigma-70 family RNA polymerase sigma factor [Bryobacteraceae bacterium]|nr:sigma-70 family RNA polymerase sigma factor [Bryobacteraceae bacterium]
MERSGREYEAELARGLMAGEAGAFDRFVGYFGGKIFHYSRLMCGHREDAEEVAQETLLKVFESAEQLREPERVKSWIFRIARNECLMKRRKSVFAPVHELSLDELMPARTGDGDEMRMEIADWRSLPDARTLQSEMRQQLEAAIRALPEAYRSVLLLRDVEELSTEETGQILDLTGDVVRTRLHRARLAVRRSLDAYLRGASETAGRSNG